MAKTIIRLYTQIQTTTVPKEQSRLTLKIQSSRAT